jgi:hypothetical protein
LTHIYICTHTYTYTHPNIFYQHIHVGVNLSSPQSITNIPSSPTDVRTPLDVRTPRDVLTPIDVRTSDVLTPVDVRTSHSTDVHTQSSGARTNETTVAPLFAQLVPRSPERTQYLHAHVVSPSPVRAQYFHADAVDLFGHPNALLGEDQRFRHINICIYIHIHVFFLLNICIYNEYMFFVSFLSICFTDK